MNPLDQNNGTGFLNKHKGLMRVVSLGIVLIYLEQIQLNAEHMINMLEISFKHHKTLELDLDIAKRNLR